MSSSMQSCPTFSDNNGGAGCRLIVAVFGHDRMGMPAAASLRLVPGDPQFRSDGAWRASLAGRVHSMLEAHGLEILRIEQSSEPECFALLIHARTSACSAANLVSLRKALEIHGRELGVTIRVQREELFVYMHRI